MAKIKLDHCNYKKANIMQLNKRNEMKKAKTSDNFIGVFFFTSRRLVLW